MLKKTVTTFYRALPLSLLLCLLVGGTPVLGQTPDSTFVDERVAKRLNQHYKQRVEDGFKFNAAVGMCFKSDPATESCPTGQIDFRWIPAFNGSSDQRILPFSRTLSGWSPLRRGLGGGGSAYGGIGGAATFGRGDTWPEPDPPGPPENAPTYSAKMGGAPARNDVQQKTKNNKTYTFLGQLMLVIPVQPRFLVELFVGGGFALIGEGEASAPNTVAIESQTVPALSYGISLTTPISDRVDFRIQYRGIVYYPDELMYIDSEGTRFTRDVASVSTSSLLFGAGIRLPYKEKQ